MVSSPSRHATFANGGLDVDCLILPIWVRTTDRKKLIRAPLLGFFGAALLISARAAIAAACSRAWLPAQSGQTESSSASRSAFGSPAAAIDVQTLLTRRSHVSICLGLNTSHRGARWPASHAFLS